MSLVFDKCDQNIIVAMSKSSKNSDIDILLELFYVMRVL